MGLGQVPDGLGTKNVQNPPVLIGAGSGRFGEKNRPRAARIGWGEFWTKCREEPSTGRPNGGPVGFGAGSGRFGYENRPEPARFGWGEFRTEGGGEILRGALGDA